MEFNRTIAHRFVDDCNLPIPVINEETFNYHLDMYEPEFGARTKWEQLVDEINLNFDGDYNKFIEAYREVRDSMISKITGSEEYDTFMCENLNKYYINEKYSNIKKSIYTEDNNGKWFMSIDLAKGNFSSLHYHNPRLVLNCDSYDELVSKFTSSKYIRESKYVRQVVFGKRGAGRQTAIENYMIVLVLNWVNNKYNSKNLHLTTITTDEIVFQLDGPDTFNEQDIVTMIDHIRQELGVKVHIDTFQLFGYNFMSKDHGKHFTFYVKHMQYSDSKRKYMYKGIPEPFHCIAYKLVNNKPLSNLDYLFRYEGICCQYNTEFWLEKLDK